LTAPSAVIGTDPGGTEVLRAQNLRAGGGIFSDIYSNTVVVGTDPGGTESLRAGSARLNAPVLLGSVPQFTMADDPTAGLEVATKQYADTKVAKSTAETITAQHTFNPSTTGAPFLIGTNASGQLVTGLNADMIDGLHLSEITAPPTISVFSTPGTYTWNKPDGCKKIWIRCWGGGGGGGGANPGSSGSGAGGGGAGGNYVEKLLNVDSISSATVTVGSGGSGGANDGSGGFSGGSSIFQVGTTIYARAVGGGGGSGAAAPTDAAGGTPSSSGNVGDFVALGESGWRGMRSISLGGRGGGSPAGGTGAGAFPGAGGNGAFSTSGGSASGSNGANGLVVIVEFY
jgi:hypothetical protein